MARKTPKSKIRPPAGDMPSGRERCKAKTKAGSPCKKAAREGGYCHFHAQRGRFSGNITTGRFSSAPAEFRAALANAKARGDLWDSEVSLALMDVRADELARRLELSDGASDDTQFRDRAVELFQTAKVQLSAGDPSKIAVALSKLERHLNQGGSRDRVWAQLIRLTLQREDRADSCRTINLRSEVALNVRHVEAIIQAVFTILGQELDHVDALRCIDRIVAEVVDPNAGALPGEIRAK